MLSIREYRYTVPTHYCRNFNIYFLQPSTNSVILSSPVFADTLNSVCFFKHKRYLKKENKFYLFQELLLGLVSTKAEMVDLSLAPNTKICKLIIPAPQS
jgi:hypothetical protein